VTVLGAILAKLDPPPLKAYLALSSAGGRCEKET